MKRIFRKIWRQLRGQHNHGRQALRSCWAQPSTEELESRRLLSADIALYHNYAMPEDVNDDGALTLWDALQVHREMLAAQTLPLDLSPALNRGAPLGPAPEGEGGTDDAYFDVNGDNYLSPRDIQLVARGLNPEAHLGDKVHYDLRIFDTDAGIERAVGLYDSNSTVVNVDLGDSFEFRVYVQDSRAGVLQAQMGVARAYVNANYDPALVSTTGPLTHSLEYDDPLLNSGDFTTTAGVIDTAGSQQAGFTLGTAVPLEDQLVLLYSIPFNADAVGTFSFTSESPDLTPPRDEQFGVLLFNDAAFTVLPTDIYFDRIDVNVVVSPVQAVSDAETINEDPLTPPVFDVLGNDMLNGIPVVQPGDLIITEVTPLTTANGSTIAINPGGLDLTYTPALNFNGTEIFIYEATDVATGTFSDTGQLTVTVDPVNDAPIPNVDGNLDTFTISENLTLTITDQSLLTNDQDPDGDPFFVEGVNTTIAPALQGTLTQQTFLPAQQTWLYDPTVFFNDLDAGENGSDTFFYRAEDVPPPPGTALQSLWFPVRITVTGVNDGPQPDPTALDPADDTVDLGTTDDNTSVDYDLTLLGLTDPEGHTFSILLPDPAESSEGAGLSIVGNTLTYDPDQSASLNALFESSDSLPDDFIIIARDQNGAETEIPFKIVVTGADDPIQVLYPPTLDAFTDQPLAFNIADGLPDPNLAGAFYDPDSDISFFIDDTATQGEIADNGGGAYTYDPNGQFNYIVYPATGLDTFVLNAVSLNDGVQTSSASPTVEITIEQDVRLPVIEGMVFADTNGNGVQEAWENPIEGVEIEIRGKDVTDAWLSVTVFTDHNGMYSFAESAIGFELVIGDYMLIEHQPEYMLDSQDFINGLPNPLNDLVPITDAGSVPGDFVFTELGLDPAYLSLAPYLTTSPQEGLFLAFDDDGNLAWTFGDDSWDGYSVVLADFSPDLSTLFVTVEDVAGGTRHLLEIPTAQNQQYCPYSMDGDTGVLRLNGPPGNFIP